MGSIRATAAAARRVLVLAGPTSVGKSSMAMSVARAVDGEIVGADSVQVFRGLDIGSNKSTAAERGNVSHHVVDIADVTDGDFSAGTYLDLARGATDDILRRNKVPIVVGGTMMYLRWYLRGRPSTPPPASSARDMAEEIVKQSNGDWDIALKSLTEKDPVRASMLFKNDWYRLRRALEISETIGPMSALPQTGASPLCTAPEPTPEYDFRCVFLYDDRIKLNRRIDLRCEHMVIPSQLLNSGIPGQIEEALKAPSILSETGRLLLDCGTKIADTSPARSIGYRQTIEYLTKRALSLSTSLANTDDGEGDNANDNDSSNSNNSVEDFRTYIADFQQATRQYAKQQMAWFRKDPMFRWVRSGPNAQEVLLNLLELDESEYGLLTEEMKESQQEIHEDIIQQGKNMRTYIPAKEILENGSSAEKMAMELGECIAEEIAHKLTTEELTVMLEFATKL